MIPKLTTTRRFSGRCFSLLIFCTVAAAQTHSSSSSAEPLAALLVRMRTAMSANGKLAQQYTSDELLHNMNFDKNGKTTVDETAKYENVFVEGLPYRRKVEENGKPLSDKAAEAEKKRYESTVEERKHMSLEDKRRGLHFTYNFSLPVCCLATLFENRIVRHEAIGGRDTIVVESMPKPGAAPADQGEKSSLDWKETTWIDAEDAMPVRVVAELLTDRGHMSKGMTQEMDFIRLGEASAGEGTLERPVWLQHDSISSFHFKVLWIGATGRTEQVWSNFKKFHVDMRLLDDSIQVLPDEHGNQQH